MAAARTASLPARLAFADGEGQARLAARVRCARASRLGREAIDCGERRPAAVVWGLLLGGWVIAALSPLSTVPPLHALLSELPGNILRAKGFVKIYDGPGLPLRDQIVHLAGHRVELQTPSPEVQAVLPTEGALVFIGEHLDESWLRLRLSACAAPLAAESAT